MVNNWNLCLRRARGEYIKFVFGDDVLISKDALLKMDGAAHARQSISPWLPASKIIDEHPHFPDRSSF